MTRTYTITRGQHDNPPDYSITYEVTGAVSGDACSPRHEDWVAVATAIRTTLADGLTRTVVCGTPEPAPDVSALARCNVPLADLTDARIAEWADALRGDADRLDGDPGQYMTVSRLAEDLRALRDAARRVVADD